MTIREQLRACIKARRVTRFQLATLTGMSPPAVYTYFAGKRDITTATLERMMGVLGLTICLADTLPTHTSPSPPTDTHKSAP